MGAILCGPDRTRLDDGGRESPLPASYADPCGRTWTRHGDLPIRRLGVRVPPGVLLKALALVRTLGCPLTISAECLQAIARWSSQVVEDLGLVERTEPGRLRVRILPGLERSLVSTILGREVGSNGIARNHRSYQGVDRSSRRLPNRAAGEGSVCRSASNRNSGRVEGRGHRSARRVTRIGHAEERGRRRIRADAGMVSSRGRCWLRCDGHRDEGRRGGHRVVDVGSHRHKRIG